VTEWFPPHSLLVGASFRGSAGNVVAMAAIQEQPSVDVSPPTSAELRTMFRAFKDAKDRWKIDNATMKGFYLHSESGYLYTWDQPTGILYEFEQSTGQCQAVWTSACPQLNAEIWTVLPLPPTDPASLQASAVQSGNLPNIDVFLILTVAHEAGKQVPADVIEPAVEEFCNIYQLSCKDRHAIQQLPVAGQGFVVQNFRDAPEAFPGYMAQVRRQKPWGNSACTLRVEATGAIIGRCCPDLDALCREDPPKRLAQAHCKIASEQDRFFICDMNTSEEGTLLDGFSVNDEWVGPLQSGSLLTVGPLRIKIQLSDVAKDTPVEAAAADRSLFKRTADAVDSDDDYAVGNGDRNQWKRKVFQKTEEPDHKRQMQYKDRAEERRKRCGNESGKAIDTLISKFEKIKEAEKAAEEAEEKRIDMPTQHAHREANMNVDGSFMGFGDFQRAGIGFQSQIGPELIPEVPDPRNLSAQDASKLKTQLRFQQANR